MSTLPLPAAGTPIPPAPKPRAFAAFVLALVLPVAIVLALHAALQATRIEVGDRVQRLAEATRIDSDSLEPPHADGHPIRLPLFEPREADKTPQPAWFRVPFALPADAKEPYLLVVSFRPNLLAYLDGHLLAQSTASNLFSRGDRGFQLGSRTIAIQVPPSLLEAGRHELMLRVGAPGYDGATLSTPQLGPAPLMESLQESRARMLWWRGMVLAAAAVLGIFLVLVWAALRKEWIYGLAGVQCLLLALLLSPNLLAEAPLPAPWWRLVLDAADVAAKALVLILVVRLFEAGPPVVARGALAYLAVGVAVDAFAAYHGYAWTDFSQAWPWWALGSRAAVLALATGLLCHAVWRQGGVMRLAAAVVVGLGAWTWFYVSFFVLVLPGRVSVIDLNFVGFGAWVLLLGALLRNRYVASLQREQATREDLERQVRERTVQLEANFAALRESEALRLAATERERLLQEMHDGLGSQLLLAKMNAQRGSLSRDEMVRTCDDCIQEMRLAVDGLSVADGDLALLLANLRHRFGGRIGAAGLELEWSVGDTPLVPSLRGTGGPDLVRIVQEAINNVIHHAQAKRIRIATEREGESAVLVTIADDGRGMPSGAGEGRGLRNIRARAARLGATVEWRAGGAGGTELRLRLPLADPRLARTS